MSVASVVTRGFGTGSFDGSIALVVTRGYGAGAAVATPQGRPRRQVLPPMWVLPGVRDIPTPPSDSVLTFLVAPPLASVASLVARESISVSLSPPPLVDVVPAPREQASGERRYHLEATIDDYQEMGIELAIRGKPELLAAVRAWKRANQ